MAKLETVKCHHPNGGHMWINKEDFDPKVHKLAEAPKKAAAPSKEAAPKKKAPAKKAAASKSK